RGRVGLSPVFHRGVCQARATAVLWRAPMCAARSRPWPLPSAALLHGKGRASSTMEPKRRPDRLRSLFHRSIEEPNPALPVHFRAQASTLLAIPVLTTSASPPIRARTCRGRSRHGGVDRFHLLRSLPVSRPRKREQSPAGGN